MLKVSGKAKKSPPQKIKLVAKHPRRIATAVKAWVAEAEKTDCDPLKLDGAPEWAERALAEAVKILLPGKRLPTDGKMDLRLLGELIGRQQAIGKVFEGEIPCGPEMQADIERLEKLAAAQPKTRNLAARNQLVAKDVVNIKNANTQAIPQLTAAALASSHADATEFQTGLLNGMRFTPEDQDVSKHLQRHSQTFWEIGLQWRKYYQCRSVASVHRKLCDELGEEKICSLKHFESRVAKKIGMKFGRGGRPPKLK